MSQDQEEPQQKSIPQTVKFLYDNYSSSVVSEIKQRKFMQCNKRFQWNIYQELGEQYKSNEMGVFEKFVYKMKEAPEKVEISQEEMDDINQNFKGNYYYYCAKKTNEFLDSLFSEQIQDFRICIDECNLRYKDSFMAMIQKSRCRRKCEDNYNRTVKRVFNEKVPEEEKKKLTE